MYINKNFNQREPFKPMSQLRFDCGTTTTRLRRKIDMFNFAGVESRRMEAGARDTSYSRTVVVS